MSKIRRATASDDATLGAFVREQFNLRPEIQGNTALWTDHHALEVIERHFCVLALDDHAIAGVVILVDGEIALGNEPFLCDRLSMAIATGGSRVQVRTLDLLLAHAGRHRWEPERILLMDVVAATDPMRRKWWASLGGSETVGKVGDWGIVPTAVALERVKGRLG